MPAAGDLIAGILEVTSFLHSRVSGRRVWFMLRARCPLITRDSSAHPGVLCIPQNELLWDTRRMSQK